MMGIGALPFEYPLRLGNDRASLARKAGQIWPLKPGRICWCLAGTRVGDRSIPAPELLARDKKVIHIDIDPAEIGKNIPADIPVVGDLSIDFGTALRGIGRAGIESADRLEAGKPYIIKRTVLLELPSRDRPDPRGSAEGAVQPDGAGRAFCRPM